MPRGIGWGGGAPKEGDKGIVVMMSEEELGRIRKRRTRKMEGLGRGIGKHL